MPNFEKRHYNYSEWAKARFSEVVTVSGPGTLIFLAGVGAEDENGIMGTILYPGDVLGQCRYAFDKIKRTLARHRATFADVVKIVTYVTDVRSAGAYFQSSWKPFQSLPARMWPILTIP